MSDKDPTDQAPSPLKVELDKLIETVGTILEYLPPTGNWHLMSPDKRVWSGTDPQELVETALDEPAPTRERH